MGIEKDLGDVIFEMSQAVEAGEPILLSSDEVGMALPILQRFYRGEGFDVIPIDIREVAWIKERLHEYLLSRRKDKTGIEPLSELMEKPEVYFDFDVGDSGDLYDLGPEYNLLTDLKGLYRTLRTVGA